MYGNEQEYVRCIMSTCYTETICQDIRSSFSYCDNHKSGILFKMLGDSVQKSGNKRQVSGIKR